MYILYNFIYDSNFKHKYDLLFETRIFITYRTDHQLLIILSILTFNTNFPSKRRHTRTIFLLSLYSIPNSNVVFVVVFILHQDFHQHLIFRINLTFENCIICYVKLLIQILVLFSPFSGNWMNTKYCFFSSSFSTSLGTILDYQTEIRSISI